MEFRQASPRKQKQPPAKKRKSGQSQIDTFAHRVVNPIARKRSHQQIMAETNDFDNSPWGDTDDEYTPNNDDPIELSDQEVPIVASRRAANPPVRAPSRHNEVIELDRSNTISPVQLFQQLQSMSLSVSEKIVLQAIRLTVPPDQK